MKQLPSVIKIDALLERWQKVVFDRETLYEYVFDLKLKLVLVNPPGEKTQLRPYRYYPVWNEVAYLSKIRKDNLRDITVGFWHFFWAMTLNKITPEVVDYGNKFTRVPPLSTKYLEALIRDKKVFLDVVRDVYSDGAGFLYLALPKRSYRLDDLGVLREEVIRFESVMQISITENAKQRRIRLKQELQEEIRRNGQRGAISRLAKKEGIARPTLSMILSKN